LILYSFFPIDLFAHLIIKSLYIHCY